MASRTSVAAQQLLRDPTIATKRCFDERYGPGASDRLIADYRAGKKIERTKAYPPGFSAGNFSACAYIAGRWDLSPADVRQNLIDFGEMGSGVRAMVASAAARRTVKMKADRRGVERNPELAAANCARFDKEFGAGAAERFVSDMEECETIADRRSVAANWKRSIGWVEQTYRELIGLKSGPKPRTPPPLTRVPVVSAKQIVAARARAGTIGGAAVLLGMSAVTLADRARKLGVPLRPGKVPKPRAHMEPIVRKREF